MKKREEQPPCRRGLWNAAIIPAVQQMAGAAETPLRTLPLRVLQLGTLFHQIVWLLPHSAWPLFECHVAQKGISRLPLTPYPALFSICRLTTA